MILKRGEHGDQDNLGSDASLPRSIFPEKASAESPSTSHGGVGHDDVDRTEGYERVRVEREKQKN